MTEKHKKDGLGRVLDGVDTTPTFRNDLSLYDVGRDSLGRFSVPTLLHRGAVNERLILANFDGTGNDADGDPEHRTNVYAIHRDASASSDPRVQSRYLRGPGTQEKTFFRGLDGGLGYSHDRRVRKMYDMVADQAQRWIAENPDSDIRVVITGFSRGAEQAASLARMIHERGLAYGDANGLHQLTPPGKIPQSVMLFDPVGTGMPHVYDRRLASSVVSGLQIVARDERRSQFPSSTLIRQGVSADGRFLGITVPGAHSDVGGSYHMDGLSRASLALGMDFLNAQVETPFLQRPDLRENIWEYDGHKSEQHSIIYTTGAADRLGERDTRGAERFPMHCRPVEECAPPEPVDGLLLSRIGPVHPVSVGQTPLDLIGREIAVDQAPEDQPRLPPDIDETRAMISQRDLAADASWADHFQEAHREPREPATQIEFSRSPPFEPEAMGPTPTSPAHPTHRDHRLYNSIHDKLTDVHKEEGITLSTQQMDRLAHCSVATAKQCGMSDVSHLSLGEDRQGNLLPEVHLYQAFRGDLDDPRTKWGKLDALEAFQTPVEAASRDLQVANQQMDQVQQDQQMRMAQQQEQGMSMSL